MSPVTTYLLNGKGIHISIQAVIKLSNNSASCLSCRLGIPSEIGVNGFSRILSSFLVIGYVTKFVTLTDIHDNDVIY